METRQLVGLICLLGLVACTGADALTETAPSLPGSINAAGAAGGASAEPVGGASCNAGSAHAGGAAAADTPPAVAGTAGTGGTSGSAGEGSSGGGSCVEAAQPCQTEQECCAELVCDMTSLGQVCCGRSGASCATENGEDCCGNLLCVAGQCTPPDAAPSFQAPFPCGESWTYSHHSAEVRRALDFVRDDGVTNNAPVLAAAAGLATRHNQPGGAGQYVAVEHTGGYETYYFHLQAYSVADGTQVTQGQEVGRVGSTGASSGPHLHFEQLKDGVGQDIVLNDQPLSPYPGSYGQKSVISLNCP